MAKQRYLAALVVVLTLITIPATASAGVGHGRYEHDGFFFRPIVLGYEYIAAWATDGGISREVQTGAVRLDPLLMLGGTIAEDLVLYTAFNASLFTVFDAKQTQGGVESSMGTGSARMITFGAGMDYYFMPRNLFLGAIVGFTELAIENDSRAASSGWGIGGRLHFGREWWISENWGWGVAGNVTWAFVPDQWSKDGDPFWWSVVGAGLITTLTYN